MMNILQELMGEKRKIKRILAKQVEGTEIGQFSRGLLMFSLTDFRVQAAKTISVIPVVRQSWNVLVTGVTYNCNNLFFTGATTAKSSIFCSPFVR